MKKIFLMLLAMMFAVGTVGNASAKSFENISENNQMVFLDDYDEEEVEEEEEVEDEDDGEDDSEDDGDDGDDGEE